MNCGTCKYWEESEVSNDPMEGFCVRYPPVLFVASTESRVSTSGDWCVPGVRKGDWCGEYIQP